MATITITIEDHEIEGGHALKCSGHVDPPVMPGDVPTPAHMACSRALSAIMEGADEVIGYSGMSEDEITEDTEPTFHHRAEPISI